MRIVFEQLVEFVNLLQLFCALLQVFDRPRPVQNVFVFDVLIKEGPCVDCVQFLLFNARLSTLQKT